MSDMQLTKIVSVIEKTANDSKEAFDAIDKAVKVIELLESQLAKKDKQLAICREVLGWYANSDNIERFEIAETALKDISELEEGK